MQRQKSTIWFVNHSVGTQDEKQLYKASFISLDFLN
jgi:hypothetical protein